jgi:hypothetical protein
MSCTAFIGGIEEGIASGRRMVGDHIGEFRGKYESKGTIREVVVWLDYHSSAPLGFTFPRFSDREAWI